MTTNLIVGGIYRVIEHTEPEFRSGKIIGRYCVFIRRGSMNLPVFYCEDGILCDLFTIPEHLVEFIGVMVHG